MFDVRSGLDDPNWAGRLLTDDSDYIVALLAESHEPAPDRLVLRSAWVALGESLLQSECYRKVAGPITVHAEEVVAVFARRASPGCGVTEPRAPRPNGVEPPA